MRGVQTSNFYLCRPDVVACVFCSATGTDFQKASCTLDASVKIYSYRVDDVWSSSYRVLENLNRTGDRKSAYSAV